MLSQIQSNEESGTVGEMKRLSVHVGLWLCVVAYTLLGASTFRFLESSSPDAPDGTWDGEGWAGELALRLGNLSHAQQRLELSRAKRLVEEWDAALGDGYRLADILGEERRTTSPKWRWSFASSVLFSYTLITTIGYGNVTPSTNLGRVFTILYALVGIPLTMLAIADLGKFCVEGLTTAYKRLSKAFPRKEQAKLLLADGDAAEGTGVARALALGASFAALLLVSGALLPLWEDGLGFLDALYFCFVTVTTIGFGDIVPYRAAFLPLSLLLITFGLAFTTIFIEEASGTFKRLHYFGARLSNVADAAIWFGGRQLSVGKLVTTVGRKWGVPESELAGLDLDRIVDEATGGPESPPPTPPPPPQPIGPETFRSIVENGGGEAIAFMDDGEPTPREVAA